MRIERNRFIPAFLLCLLLPHAAHPQTPAPSPCDLDQPPVVAAGASIFTDAQEQDLGDALAEYVESDMRIAPPAADDQLTRIGERLLAGLPSTGVHYRFR